MVSTQNYDLQWISYFKCKQEADNFTALLSSIDVVSHEEVSGIFRNDIVWLFLLIFVTHFFKHME